jgi:hypothetical protein
MLREAPTSQIYQRPAKPATAPITPSQLRHDSCGTPRPDFVFGCFTSLDALIAAETQKHEAVKTHKKGLMQQLFPSPEEVAA